MLDPTTWCCKVQATQLARETLEAVAAEGKLGQAGRGAKVIYAQTDSVFASFPNATAQEAIQVQYCFKYHYHVHAFQLKSR